MTSLSSLYDCNEFFRMSYCVQIFSLFSQNVFSQHGTANRMAPVTSMIKTDTHVNVVALTSLELTVIEVIVPKNQIWKIQKLFMLPVIDITQSPPVRINPFFLMIFTLFLNLDFTNHFLFYSQKWDVYTRDVCLISRMASLAYWLAAADWFGFTGYRSQSTYQIHTAYKLKDQ